MGMLSAMNVFIGEGSGGGGIPHAKNFSRYIAILCKLGVPVKIDYEAQEKSIPRGDILVKKIISLTACVSRLLSLASRICVFIRGRAFINHPRLASNVSFSTPRIFLPPIFTLRRISSLSSSRYTLRRGSLLL